MNQTIDREGQVGPAPAAAEAALQEVLAGWNRASSSWDADGLAAMYWEDAMLFGGRPYLSVGVDGIRDYFVSYAAQLVSVGLVLRDQVLVAPAPDLLLAQGFAEFSFRLADGRDTGATMRTSLVLMRRDGRWKIQQHHFSDLPAKPPTEA
jgi:uncharacterized protein (TIGR02246 family)